MSTPSTTTASCEPLLCAARRRAAGAGCGGARPQAFAGAASTPLCAAARRRRRRRAAPAPLPRRRSAKNPSGEDINALEQHIKNLLTPSTPDFFNTLYDPYAPGADFVRGYPFSMREGKHTAVSHGLWLNIPDYDAPTQVHAVLREGGGAAVGR